jgi:hypothetical protein
VAAILKRDKIKRKGGGWLKSGARELVREHYNLRWLPRFQQLIWVMLLLFVVMIVLAFVGDN